MKFNTILRAVYMPNGTKILFEEMRDEQGRLYQYKVINEASQEQIQAERRLAQKKTKEFFDNYL